MLRKDFAWTKHRSNWVVLGIAIATVLIVMALIHNRPYKPFKDDCCKCAMELKLNKDVFGVRASVKAEGMGR